MRYYACIETCTVELDVAENLVVLGLRDVVLGSGKFTDDLVASVDSLVGNVPHL